MSTITEASSATSTSTSTSTSTPTSLNVVRLLGMRRFPGLDQVEIDDLAKLLSATTERVVRKNTVLARRGTPLGASYFVIEGQLRVTGTMPARVRGANTIAGIVEMVAGNQDGLHIECVTDAVVLELEKADFLAFSSDNFEMLAELLRTFSAKVLKLSPFEGIANAERRIVPPPPEQLNAASFVERLRLLHRMEALKPFGAETISDLAVALRERRVSSSRALVRAGQALDSLYVVISGSLEFGERRALPGTVFGLLHAISESPLPFDLLARQSTRVLTCRREVLSDLLEDNTAFTLAWLRQLAQRILELREANPE